MDVVEYVSRRMLLDVCDIAMIRNDQLDTVYQSLHGSMIRYSNDERYIRTAARGLPPAKATEGELLSDMLELYSSILRGAIDHHSISTIRCLFTVSLYMMKKYENDISLCSLIPCYFQLISERLRGWSYFESTFNDFH